MINSTDKENIRIIFSDLDGTLLNSDRKLSKANIEAVKKIREKGILFVAATARPERAIEEYCSRIEFDGIISLNGAVVRCKDKNIYNGIPYNVISEIIKVLCAKNNKTVAIETDKGIYSNTVLKDWGVDKVSDLIEEIKNCVVFKVLVFGKNNKLERKALNEENMLSLDEIEEEVRSLVGEKTYYTISENWICQIMSSNATKRSGMKEVLETLGISKDKSMYFGDDNDDISCIKNAGIGVAMGNAIPKAKEAADIIIKTNDEDGIADFLSKNLF